MCLEVDRRRIGEATVNRLISSTAVDFFDQIRMLYETIAEFCTPQDCPVMGAGPKYEYMWADGGKVKKAIRCSAPDYVDYLMEWVQVGLFCCPFNSY